MPSAWKRGSQRSQNTKIKKKKTKTEMKIVFISFDDVPEVNKEQFPGSSVFTEYELFSLNR